MNITSKFKLLNMICVSLMFISMILMLISYLKLAIISILICMVLFSFIMFAIRRISAIDIIDPNIVVLLIIGSLGLVLVTIVV